MRELDKLAAELRSGRINRFDFLRAAAGLGLTAAAAASALDPFNALSVMAATNPNVTPAHPTQKSKYKIGFSQSELNNGFRVTETDSMANEAKLRANKYTYQFTNAHSDTNQQVTDVNTLIAAKCDLIVLTPREIQPLRAATQNAIKAGVPVIEIDRTSAGKAGVDYVTVIESNFIQQAKKVATWMVANTRGTINYVELLGSTGASPAIDRHTGFHDVIDGVPRFKSLGAQDGDFTLVTGKQVMTNFISKYGTKIDMIYAANDDMAVGALQALKQAGITKKMYIGSIDGSKRAIEYVAQGVFSVCVQSNPHFGPVTFDVIDKYFAGQKIPTFNQVQDHTYTKSNAASLLSTGF